MTNETTRRAAAPARPRPVGMSSLTKPSLLLAPLLVATGLLATGCRTATDRDRSVEELFGQQRYAAAYQLAAERAEAAPDDAEAADLLERARVAYWMDEGRALVLAGDPGAGREIFFALRDDGVTDRVIGPWIDKCNRMLAERRRGEAWSAELLGNFDDATELYREAVELWPADDFARDGLERIELLAQWRAEQGSDYYNNGIRDLRNLRMAEALRSFRAAADYLSEDPDAVRRADEVLTMQANERVQLADGLLAEGLFHAAAAELRHAQILLDTLPGIDDRIAAAEREVDVLEGLGESDRLLRRADADGAITLLEGLLETTQFQGEAVEAALVLAREARLDGFYQVALDLERDFHFDEAIDAYDVLLEEAGGFHKDAIQRQRTLRNYVDLAEELYGEYEDATDDDARLSALRKIELFWPTYRDVPARLAELEDADEE